MRAILGILIGLGFIAFAVGMIPLEDDPPPLFFNVVFGVMGAIAVLASIAHLRLRIKRRFAYANGREKRGTARLHGSLGSDAATATIVFATSFQEWVMSVDAGTLGKNREGLHEGLRATAYFGDDERIYGLDIEGKRIMPISAGVPLDREMKDRLEKIERRFGSLNDDAPDQKV